MAYTVTHNSHEVARVYGKTDWSAAVWSGIIAGAVFMMMQMLLVMLINGQSPWAPPRMIAAMVLGKDVLPPPAGFDLGVMMTAMMVHFALSIMLGLVVDWIVHRMTAGKAIAIGAVLGLAVYLVNFYLIASAVFPWFTQAQNWITAMNHIVFGMVLSGAYVGLRKPKLAPDR